MTNIDLIFLTSPWLLLPLVLVIAAYLLTHFLPKLRFLLTVAAVALNILLCAGILVEGGTLEELLLALLIPTAVSLLLGRLEETK